MIGFIEHNVNPKGKKACDCVIRALTSATGRPYLEVYKELFEISCKVGYVVNEKRCYEKFLEQNGFVKCKQPRKWDNTKYQIGELDDVIGDEDVVVVSCANHLTCIDEGMVIDTWDCRDCCVGNYYIKVE